MSQRTSPPLAARSRLGSEFAFNRLPQAFARRIAMLRRFHRLSSVLYVVQRTSAFMIHLFGLAMVSVAVTPARAQLTTPMVTTVGTRISTLPISAAEAAYYVAV